LWNAISDPGFHRCSNCPLRNNSNKSNLPINTQTQFIGNKRKINYDDNANMQKTHSVTENEWKLLQNLKNGNSLSKNNFVKTANMLIENNSESDNIVVENTNDAEIGHFPECDGVNCNCLDIIQNMTNLYGELINKEG
jgi:hypothetical protein